MTFSLIKLLYYDKVVTHYRGEPKNYTTPTYLGNLLKQN